MLTSPNYKKFQRLWRDEGLRVPRRQRCELVGSSTIDAPADAPNTVWAVDFQFDVCERGQVPKICPIVDEHPREGIGGLLERSITADRFIEHLEALIAQRGAQAVWRSDNGPEFISEAVMHGAANRTTSSYIPPGQPWHSGYVESFNARLRDERLMGVATTLIGLFPTYAAIGVGAPIMLILQGISVGGEWGGAALGLASDGVHCCTGSM